MPKVIDGKATIEQFTSIVKAHNRSQTKAGDKLRLNAKEVAKRLVYDFRNAFNKGKVYQAGSKEALRQNRVNLPYIVVGESGEHWIITANALISHMEEISMTNRSVKQNLEKLANGRAYSGLIVEEVISAASFVLKGLGNMSSNDIAIKLNPKVLAFQEAKTHPQHPPNETHKHTERASAGASNSAGTGISKRALESLADRFNAKHKHK